jgi:carbamoyltransferase
MRGGVFARWGPKHPHLAGWGSQVGLWALDKTFSRRGIHRPNSALGRARLAALEQTISAGREAYLLGIASGVHNAGAALVRVSQDGAVELVCNDEEERYTAVKHCTDYPEHSIRSVIQRMQALGIGAEDLAACVSSWDYAAIASMATLRPMLEEAPASLTLLRSEQAGEIVSSDSATLLEASTRLGRQLGLEQPIPIIGVRHHDCHAYFSYAVSPFAGDPDPVMVLVADGSGDDSSLSLYSCQAGRLELLSTQGSTQLDSIGSTYGVLSSTQGGWPMLSSEGRYMGAAAWGDGNRLTNRYYRRLKHIFHLGPGGEVNLNRMLANWTRQGWATPYSEELIEILGQPIPLADMWNPDAVLNVEDVRHPEVTRDRVDKAAAVQLVFEDALAHVVDHLIRTTGGHRLILTGGTALNCVANMRLLECFDERWYERNLGRKGTQLHIWVPPAPSDTGAPAGAA